MSDKHDPSRAVEFLIANASKFGQAKADRVYIESFMKSKKAMLMQESTAKTVSEREADAYAHPDYIGLIDGLKVAVEVEETLRYQLKAAELRVDVWRSQEASNRNQDRTLR